jgi:hypothetical protein
MLRKFILEESRDDDGYWIILRDGWCDGFNPGCHTIVENTKREAYQHDAVPCECRECKDAALSH